MSIMDIVARDLRESHDMMVVAANWYTLGLPEGLFTAHEGRHGVHAGDLESSVMLHLHARPRAARERSATSTR